MIARNTYVNALKDALPDLIKDNDLASKILDVVFSVPARALENGDKVELPGLGVLSIDKSKGSNCLTYSPEKAFIQCLIK
ncbi:MAG: hypothetical protein P4L39_07990 [Humidesulfovibrio sp.]|nr:hypothetical protein [Humidesulfovibrio sp.]